MVGIDVAAPGTADLGFEIECADITDREPSRAAASRIEAAPGPVDVLVNNAGIDQPPDAAAATHEIEDVPLEDFEATLDVNLVGTFNVTPGVRRRNARPRRGARSSTSARFMPLVRPTRGFYDHIEVDPPFLKPAAYGASKAGVVSLTAYFARLWGPAGVRVNSLSPGGVAGGQDSEFVRKYTERVPLRPDGRARDLAGPLVFLASDASRYVTGQDLRVDGGITV